RSYTTQATSVVPQFLAQSFEMFRDSQTKWVENVNAMNPMASVPGFEAMQAQQEAFLKAMTGGMGSQWSAPQTEKEDAAEGDDLDSIKRELAELQKKLAKFSD
ncbi:MAG: polyhydroxyalkanoate synthesis repressor PhaR, partial [Thalassococcus sp.]|nr:polyhydroxyalkanoate synthesis repressor PhaR [Thalassococcus sp.]